MWSWGNRFRQHTTPIQIASIFKTKNFSITKRDHEIVINCKYYKSSSEGLN